MKITLKGTPPTINKYIGRSNIWEYQEDKKKYARQVQLQTIGKNPKISECTMKITYYFGDKRRRDPGNYEKMLLDALVESNIIIDDSYNVITEFTSRAKVDKNNPRVEIEINPIRYDLCMRYAGSCKSCPNNMKCEEEYEKSNDKSTYEWQNK